MAPFYSFRDLSFLTTDSHGCTRISMEQCGEFSRQAKEKSRLWKTCQN